MIQQEFIRISAISLPVAIADATANADSIGRFADRCRDSDLVLFPELCLTGYTCGDLFAQQHLLDSTLLNLHKLCDANHGKKQTWVVGLPLRMESRLYNCAAVLSDGRLMGIVPKSYLPTYQEFYESRWFEPADTLTAQSFEWMGQQVPIGVDLLFKIGTAKVAIEICEDLWMPIPPSSVASLAGANVLLNLSASNETIGKAAWRKQLITSQAGRCVAAYAYASAGPTESTTDLVFGGHCLIAELGSVLAESERVGSDWTAIKDGAIISADIDLHRIEHDRQQMQTSLQASRRFVPNRFREIHCSDIRVDRQVQRRYNGRPFVPSNPAELADRCEDVLQIQRAALAKRLQQLPGDLPLAIGVSGGLDSTLALLVAVETCDDISFDRSGILGLTMPGFGTSRQTRSNAVTLMQELGITSQTVDIRAACLEVYRGMEHRPFGIDLRDLDVDDLQIRLQSLPDDNRSDLIFENVQARTRTLLLMSRGFVLGTGDMSESALGWSTYNGDHMSMYNVNSGVPKTLVQFLVRHVAMHKFDTTIRTTLLDIADTPISPELLPLTASGEVAQSTEATLGDYELHDFFLYHFVRTGASPKRMLSLASRATFLKEYDVATIERTLKMFLKRFFASQFKRTCVPDGPKVGSVSLSPRGDWRMPSDASVDDFLSDLS